MAVPATTGSRIRDLFVSLPVNPRLRGDSNANTGNHSVCLNSTQPYGVVLTAGSTPCWSITPITRQ